MLKYFFKLVINIVVDFLYPKHCVVCNRMLGEFTDIPICSRCHSKEIIPLCVKDDKYTFSEAVGVLKYEGNVKEVMLKYKFQSVGYYAKAYAYIMDKVTSDRPYLKEAVMCNVPMCEGRDRDYNQTALIAKELSSIWNSEYEPNLLYRCRDVSPLSKMKLDERRFYIKNSISVNPEYNIFGKDVILIDDIFTSGTTAEECARVLKMYGAGKVYVLCACYD